MIKIKCIGAGITSRGIRFTNKGNALYTVDNETADYLVKTFPKMFVKIEKIISKPKIKKDTKIGKE